MSPEMLENIRRNAEAALNAAIEAVQDNEAKLKNIGMTIWDATRDKNSIQAYFKQALGNISAQGFNQAWEMLVLGEQTGVDAQGLPIRKPSGLSQIFGAETTAKIGAWWERNKKYVNAGAAAYNLYASTAGAETTNRSEGALQGGMAGISAGAQIGGLFGGAGGGIGAVIGLLGGALFGSIEARKRAEEQAQRVREQMLSELRKLNNGIVPVVDYFRMGASLGSLTGAQSFGMSRMTTTYAVESARAAR
jgi:hypothetical protein